MNEINKAGGRGGNALVMRVTAEGRNDTQKPQIGGRFGTKPHRNRVRWGQAQRSARAAKRRTEQDRGLRSIGVARPWLAELKRSETLAHAVALKSETLAHANGAKRSGVSLTQVLHAAHASIKNKFFYRFLVFFLKYLRGLFNF